MAVRPCGVYSRDNGSGDIIVRLEGAGTKLRRLDNRARVCALDCPVLDIPAVAVRRSDCQAPSPGVRRPPELSAFRDMGMGGVGPFHGRRPRCFGPSLRCSANVDTLVALRGGTLGAGLRAWIWFGGKAPICVQIPDFLDSLNELEEARERERKMGVVTGTQLVFAPGGRNGDAASFCADARVVTGTQLLCRKP